MKLNIPIDIKRTRFLEEKSNHNDNFFYFELDGWDNTLFIREQYFEEGNYNYYKYTLGCFEKDVFIGAFSWTHFGEKSMFDEVKYGRN